jgi:hypothetical protein
MDFNNITYIFDEEVTERDIIDNISQILEDDWGYRFEREGIAAKIEKLAMATALCGYDDVLLENGEGIQRLDKPKNEEEEGILPLAAKGYFDGKFSIVINKENISIAELLASAAGAVLIGSIGSPKEALLPAAVSTFINCLLGKVVIFSELFDRERCVFAIIVLLTKNDKLISFSIEDLSEKYLLKSKEAENICPAQSIKKCPHRNYHSNCCKIKEEDIKEVLEQLIEKKAIRKTGNFYYIN